MHCTYFFTYLSHISDKGEHNRETSFRETTSAISEAIDDVCCGRGSQLIQASSEREALERKKMKPKMLEFVTPTL